MEVKEVKELVLHYRSLGPERHKSFEFETKDIHPGAFFCSMSPTTPLVRGGRSFAGLWECRVFVCS